MSRSVCVTLYYDLSDFTPIHDQEDNHSDDSESSKSSDKLDVVNDSDLYFSLDKDRIEYIKDSITYIIFRGDITEIENVELESCGYGRCPKIRCTDSELPELSLLFLENVHWNDRCY